MKPNFILEFLSRHHLRIELILTALVLAGAVLNYTGTSQGAELLMITMSILATFYFVSAYTPLPGSGLLVIVATKVIGIASSVCVIGLLFTALHLTGSANMLMIGISALSIAGLLLLYTWLTAKNNHHFSLLLRVAILGGISLSTLLEILKQSD
jgi:hypothetical protein